MLHMSQNRLPKNNYARIFRYVEAIEKQEEMNFLRICLVQTLLYLLYIKELEEKKEKHRRRIKEQD